MVQDNFPLSLTFDDVLLEPRGSNVVRSQINLETKLTKKLKLEIPILSAAMDTVTEDKMAIALGKLGGLGVLHRNCLIKTQAAWVKKVKKQKLLSAAAVGPQDLERAKALSKAGADVLVVDTAHGHHQSNILGLKKIRKQTKAQIIAGNIATGEAAKALINYADAIKVGVGPGSICTTRVVAGIGVPQLSAVLNVVKVASKARVPVIADGGIKYSGDIVKALSAGASSVMIGSMLAGTDEAPGKVVSINGEKYKSFRGMGSWGAMQGGKSSDRYFQKGAKKPVPEEVEGISKYKGKLADVIHQITGGLRSGMGYIGAHKVSEMPKRARFIRISNAGLKESHPHTVIKTKDSPNY